jgi:putative acyl-CoA dehydrogenase
MHRRAFGAPLVEQPAMANVLAELALESEAATHAALRVARSYDDAEEEPFRRLATAVMKYWVTKRAPAHAAEALECLGGNGYVEDSGMPLLFRDSPLNSIWEGSGNIVALASLDPGDAQFAVRSLVEDLALSLQASLLVRHAPGAVADGFCAARLGGRGGRVYGTLPAGVDTGRSSRAPTRYDHGGVLLDPRAAAPTRRGR